MRKTSWLDQKRQFLSDYFAKKNNGIINVFIEELSAHKENNIVSKYHSWTKLIDESKDLNSSFVLSSLDIHPSGFRTDDSRAQSILDSAFNKKVGELFDIADEDETEIIKVLIIIFIFLLLFFIVLFLNTFKSLKLLV